MNRIANLSIMVERATDDNIAKLNSILHEYKDFVIGRMGVPDKVHNINIVSVALSAPLDILNGLTGKIGNIDNVNAKILISAKEYDK